MRVRAVAVFVAAVADLPRIGRKKISAGEPDEPSDVSSDMATHGNDRMNGKDKPYPADDASLRTPGGFPGAGGDQWHRTLTGRQAPEPVSMKLRMIYGSIVAETLPDRMLDLLSRIDQQSPEQ